MRFAELNNLAYDRYVQAIDRAGLTQRSFPLSAVKGSRVSTVIYRPLGEIGSFAKYLRGYKHVSMYDHLFGPMTPSLYDFPENTGAGLVPPEILGLGADVMSALYLGRNRWMGLRSVYVASSKYIDFEAITHGSYPRGLAQHREAKGLIRGFDHPTPIPLSELMFEEFGIDPIRSAKNFVYTEWELEHEILSDPWYPRDLFYNVRTIGGFQVLYSGLKSYVVKEDFVPRSPFSVLPYDNELVQRLYGLLAFLDAVWEDPDILDDVVKHVPVVAYSRAHDFPTGLDYRFILPYLGIPWGYLFFFMNWYTITAKGVEGAQGAQNPKIAKEIHPALVTITYSPAIESAYYPVHMAWNPMLRDRIMRTVLSNNLFRTRGVIEALLEHYDADTEYFSPHLWSSWRYRTYFFPELYSQSLQAWKPGQYAMSVAPFVSASLWYAPYGAGSVVRGSEDGVYFWTWNDMVSAVEPWASILKTYKMGYHNGRNVAFFNYSSLPFLMYLRKFVFLVFEMLRRYGVQYLGGAHTYKKFFDMSMFGSVSSPAMRGLKDYFKRHGDLIYSAAHQFEEIPFDVVFNLGVSFALTTMYADVSAFRNLAMRWLSQVEALGVMPVEDGEGLTRYRAIARALSYRHIHIGTYMTSSVVYYPSLQGNVVPRGQDDFLSNAGLSAYYSPYYSGVVAMRVPWYDPTSLQFHISYGISQYLPTRGLYHFASHRYVAYYDDSTLKWFPVARSGDELYKEYHGKATPTYVARLREGIPMLHVYIAEALRRVKRIPDFAETIVYDYARFLANAQEGAADVAISLFENDPAISEFAPMLKDYVSELVGAKESDD